MSESSKPRSFAEVQQEYTRLCSKAGHVQYSIYSLQADLDVLNNTLKSLNIEAAKASQREQEEAAKAAAESAPAEAAPSLVEKESK